MIAYKTYVTIADPKHVVLSDLPFRAGQRVEVVVIAEAEEDAALVSPTPVNGGEAQLNTVKATRQRNGTHGKPLSEEARRRIESAPISRSVVSHPNKLLPRAEAVRRLDALRESIGPLGTSINELKDEGRYR
jgi:hypothetical protein